MLDVIPDRIYRKSLFWAMSECKFLFVFASEACTLQ